MRNEQKKWSSDDIHLYDRAEAWANILTKLYGRWKIPQRLPPSFSAKIQYYEFDEVMLVRTDWDTQVGRHTQHQVRRSDKHLVGLHLMTSGAARYRSGDVVVTVGSGSLSILTTGTAVEL